MMGRNFLLLLAACLIATALVCLGVVAVGVVRMLVDMPGADVGIGRIRGLQPWAYGFFAAAISMALILWFVRDPPASRHDP